MKIFLIGFLLMMLTGCADNVSFAEAEGMLEVGFWYGFWHGYTLFITWVISWFSDEVAIYAIYNNGGWYDFGFAMGVSGLFGILHPRSYNYRYGYQR